MSSLSTPSDIRSFSRADPVGDSQAEQFVPGSSFLDVLDSYRKWGTTSLLFQKMMSRGYDPDPDFEIDDTLWKDLTHNVDPDLWESYSDANSLKHALHIAEINRIVSEKRQTLANAGGVSSFTGPIIGQFLDPANVALGIITGGGGTVLRMGLGARAVTLGSMNAAASGVLTAAESTIDPSIGGMDIARSTVGGLGFGVASGALGTSGRLTRALAGAAGQALPPAALDLFDDRPGNLKAIEFGSNLLFGGVFNALPAPDARPEQIRAAEILDTLGKRMIASAEGRTVDAPLPPSQTIKEGFSAGEWKPVSGLDAMGDYPTTPISITQQLEPDGSIIAVDQQIPVLRTSVFDNESEARVYSQSIPNASIQNMFGQWVVLDRDRSFRVISNDNLTPGDIVKELGIRGRLETLYAKGYTAEQIYNILKDWLPRFDSSSGKKFVDNARRDLYIPSRNKPEELAAWARDMRIDTSPFDQASLDLFLKDTDAAIAAELAKSFPSRRAPVVNANAQSDGGIAASQEAQSFSMDNSANFGMGAAGTLIPEARVPSDPRSLDLSSRVPQIVGSDVAVSALAQRIRVGSFDFGVARWDMTGLAAASEVPEIRLAASLLGDDPTLPIDGSPRQISAASWVASRIAESENAVVWAEKEALAAFHAEQKAAGIPWRDRISATDFQRQVTRALRQGIPEGTNPHVAKAATAYRKQYDDIVALAKDHGISIDYAGNYVNRHHIADARENKAFEIGRILEPNGTRGMQRAAGLKVLRDFFVEAQEADHVRRGVKITPELREQFAGNADSIITKAGVGSFVDDSTGASLGAGQNRTVARIQMDETFQKTVTLGNGQSVTLNVSDFLEDNIGVLFHLYTRQMHGLMALSRVGELLGVKINPDDGSPIEGINSILKTLEERAIARGTPRERYLSDLKRVKSILHIVGQIPEHATNGWTRTLDFVRNVNVIQYMANSGTAIQNLGSIADTMAISGIGNTFKAMFPAIGDIVTQMRGRKMTRRQAIEIMEMGIGMERLTRRVMPRLGENLDAPVGRTKVELLAARGAKAMLDFSGQTIAQDLASMVQARAFNHSLDDMARSGQYFGNRRLAVMGLDRPSLDRIIDQFKKNAIGTDGQNLYVNGKRRTDVDLDHLGLDKWDGEIRELYRTSMWMEYQRIIQPGSPTQMPWFFNTPVGKVLSQFRTFAFQAHLNRVLSELQVRDSIMAKRYIYSTVAAALIYAGRTYLDAAVRDDKDQYLEERLSQENVWKAAFSRAAYSAMFPTFWDTLWSDMLGNDPTFSFARTTELSGGALFGSPTAQRLKELGAPMIGDGDVLRLPKALGRAAMGDMTQQDWRTIKAGIPIPDLFNLRKVMDNWARENLPTTTIN